MTISYSAYWRVGIGLAALTGISTLLLLLFGKDEPAWVYSAKWLYVIWVVGMPLWFLGETAWYAPDPSERVRLDRFKHLQENARSVWAGLSIAMAVLLIG